MPLQTINRTVISLWHFSLVFLQAGGFQVLTALYDDPDAVGHLVQDERLCSLARSMIEVGLKG